MVVSEAINVSNGLDTFEYAQRLKVSDALSVALSTDESSEELFDTVVPRIIPEDYTGRGGWLNQPLSDSQTATLETVLGRLQDESALDPHDAFACASLLGMVSVSVEASLV